MTYSPVSFVNGWSCFMGQYVVPHVLKNLHLSYNIDTRHRFYFNCCAAALPRSRGNVKTHSPLYQLTRRKCHRRFGNLWYSKRMSRDYCSTKTEVVRCRWTHILGPTILLLTSAETVYFVPDTHLQPRACRFNGIASTRGWWKRETTLSPKREHYDSP